MTLSGINKLMVGFAKVYRWSHIYISIYLSWYVWMYICMNKFISQSVHICQAINLSFYLSIYLSQSEYADILIENNKLIYISFYIYLKHGGLSVTAGFMLVLLRQSSGRKTMIVVWRRHETKPVVVERHLTY